MLLPLAAALVLLLATGQSPQADRALAEQLARSGQAVQAIAIFERIAAQNPDDLEARLWIARLQLRIGRNAEAEAGFRAALLQKPSDVDARIGLAAALLRRDAWDDALIILHDTENDAGNNAELFAIFARAYRRKGDDRRAIEYFRRALAIAPGDPDLEDGYEATLRAYGHSVEFEGVVESGASDAQSGALMASLRVLPQLKLDGLVRLKTRNGLSDALAGGGGIWRVNRSTNLAFRFSGGADNALLASGDVTAEVRRYIGAIETGFNYRHLSFTGVKVGSYSPLLAWDTGERWRLDLRYTFSVSSFQTTGRSSGDHSVVVRETLRESHRLATTLTYAYGIESFEDLTADRIRSLGGHTVAGSVRFRLRTLTTLAGTWEHQWRSNDTRIGRLTLLFVQMFP